MNQRIIITIIALLSVTSCASKVASLTEDHIKVLDEDVGYLLLGVETNRNLKGLQISGRQLIEFSHKDLTYGSNFILVDLPAGTYSINQIQFNKYWRLQITNKKYWKFTVQPGKINYVGHMEIVRKGYWNTSTSVELVNRSSEAIDFLEHNFPTILANRQLTYGGPGEDDFFNFLFPIQAINANTDEVSE